MTAVTRMYVVQLIGAWTEPLIKTSTVVGPIRRSKYIQLYSLFKEQQPQNN